MDSGPAEVRYPTPHFTLTRIRSRLVSRRHLSSRAQPSIAAILGNSFCPTMWSNSQPRLRVYCSSSYRRHMTLQPILASGIALRWNVVAGRRAQFNPARKVPPSERLRPRRALRPTWND